MANLARLDCMPHSYSEFISLRQRKLHLRHWGPATAPLLLLLHGWMDSSATFQFMVDALQHDWHVIAPDWRGFGDSQWNDQGYHSPDYLADLDALLEHLSPSESVRLVGHSMGAMVAGLYAGIRPERIKSLVLIEGFGLSDTRAQEAPGRSARWLRELRQPLTFGALQGLASIAGKLIERSPRLPPEQALWLAGQLTRTEPDGSLRYRADPRHKMVNPTLYRLAEAQACWRRISCPVLWVIGGDMWDHPMAKGVFDTLDSRRDCFARLQEVTLPEAGHMVQWEQPVALARVLEEFVLAADSAPMPD
jgi:pimeloyl-ACP methyl ester carboxylesterase